jgi:release factor glutamine methyltransferase
MTKFYEPSEDTELIMKAIKDQVTSCNRSLEIGVGSGAVSKVLAALSTTHIGVDINPYAIDAATKLVPEAIFFESDLFKKIEGTFDIIVFNPPYIPATKSDPDDWITKATVGGKKGYEIIVRFIDGLGAHLTSDGACYLLFSQLSVPEVIDTALKEHLFDFEVVANMSVMMEALFVYKITKRKILVELEDKGVTNITFVASGKHGVVFKGEFEGQVVGMKIKNEDSAAPAMIVREVANLKRVNAIDVGPKYICHADDYIMYEFAEGTVWRDWYPTAEFASVKAVLVDVLEQCKRMDEIGFEKTEMTNPYKHIIVSSSPIMIDFERGKLSSSPSNVTQFLQYLVRPEMHEILTSNGVSLSSEDVIRLGKYYTEDASVFDSILKYFQ